MGGVMTNNYFTLPWREGIKGRGKKKWLKHLFFSTPTFTLLNPA
jgi:hypothetical protein